jgi:hypothetical protein
MAHPCIMATSPSQRRLSIVLSNGQLVRTPRLEPLSLPPALLSLGSLCIIVEITFQAVLDFRVAWTQDLYPLQLVLDM